ncbi:MAG TPA: serine/threonine-protein kinase [Solirubrobacteraceae bacterium]|nr:serine/threonine-protein kinase [Solirubrobacteraceae bacterium]
MEPPGTVLAGRYRVVRHVGAGGMGSVYLAEDEVLARRVAVKSVHAEPDSEHGRRIMREARLGAGLRHPNLVTVFDVLPAGGAVLLVMELVEGETLADALRRGPLPVPRALVVLRAVADALDEAHAHGIVHRDVKPANVLLGAGGAVKLADLGIATAEDVTRITRTGGTLGTLAYMAPEQFEPGPATPAADVYALAVVAFEALSGSRPFPGATAFEVFGRLREGAEPPDVRALRPELPEGVAAALRRGMARAPEDRPASAGELVAEIEAAVAEPAAEQPAADPTREMPAAPRSRDRRPSRLAPLALLALVAAVGVVVALSVGGGDGGAERRAARTTSTEPRATAAAAAPRPPGPPTPVAAVRAFYERAAEGDLGGAWRLAGPRLRELYGSRAAFDDELGSLRAITFARIEEVESGGDRAVVAIQTVAEHTDRTDRCSGTVTTVRGRQGRWLVEPAVRCTSS